MQTQALPPPYQSVRPLTDAERELLPAMLRGALRFGVAPVGLLPAARGVDARHTTPPHLSGLVGPHCQPPNARGERRVCRQLCKPGSLLAVLVVRRTAQ